MVDDHDHRLTAAYRYHPYSYDGDDDDTGKRCHQWRSCCEIVDEHYHVAWLASYYFLP